ncbi:RNA-directed DNA polymerase (Reverse transcriptase), Ribonuclease H-like protein [Gossypium australe]|uniref:RNA-directed DNA polymerase (Reverse transcriptase), Ribonuclease H-like protein n=1 Tax=Gossypium australe TaxID=47621 RepID=A0A5B6V6P1_9ROSI|nr:RNA-directed DNA polymerase (Reverse transcriptase), Ribonuclease H-like protein [Gossypium australe]
MGNAAMDPEFPYERDMCLEESQDFTDDGDYSLSPDLLKMVEQEERHDLIKLLLEFKDVFMWSYQDMLGLSTDITVHRIPIKQECKPVQQKVANVFPVPKKDGKVQMCVDYWDLNKASPKDNFPLPHIDTLVDNTACYSLFSFMDGFSGYNQIKIHPEDMEQTTFITLWGTFCYKVMPFGLKNAGATYQRAMVTLFHDMMHKKIEVYIDDMIAKSRTEKEHIQVLRKLFLRLRKFQLKLNPTKCTFGARSGKLLGFVVSERGVEVDPDKVRAVQELPSPCTQKEVEILLSEFDIVYVNQKVVKGSVIADFLASRALDDYEPLKFDFPNEDLMIEESLTVDYYRFTRACPIGHVDTVDKRNSTRKRILREKETRSKSLYKDLKYNLEMGGQYDSQLSLKLSQKVVEQKSLLKSRSSIVKRSALASIVVIVDEDLNTQIAIFLEFCDAFKINAVSDDSMDLETLYDVWERYKDLLRRCPHHELPLWLQVQTLYNGVNPSTRQLIDSAAGGTLNNKTLEATREFIEEMSIDNYQWQTIRTRLAKTAGVFNLDVVTMLSNQQPPPNFQNQPYPQEKKSNLEEMLTKFMAATDSCFQKTEATLSEQQASIKGIKNQVGGLTKQVGELIKSVGLLTEMIHINLPFVEAISQMPKYAKFLKELLTNKRKLEEVSMVELNEECSAILQNKLPRKLKDPGSFTIPCLIGSLNIKKALADLGASINLMPYKMFKRLADRSIKYPKGVIEDVLVKIDKFIFPIDFVVLDMDEDIEVPLILGRPFLTTARAVVNIGDGKLTLRIGDEEIIFQICDAMRYSKEQDDSHYFVETTDHIIQNSLQEIMHDDTMELCPTQEADEEDEIDELQTLSSRHMERESIEISNDSKQKPSVEEPPKLELKQLPKHLEYAFLGENSTLPVIISSELEPKEKEELLQVVPKKGGMIVIANEKNELIPTRIVTSWRVCIDYRKLNDTTRKDHFPLPFIDQMLERLSGHMYYCFLDGLSGYFQIPIAPEDQKKTMFTCPYGTFAYCRMPFGLCNAPVTFQRCMLAIFDELVEDIMEEFDLEIQDKKGAENLAADHLSRLENPHIEE